MSLPAKAITGKTWIQGMKREEIYDVYACKAKAEQSYGLGSCYAYYLWDLYCQLSLDAEICKWLMTRMVLFTRVSLHE